MTDVPPSPPPPPKGPPAPGGSGYDRMGVRQPDGTLRYLTRVEFEGLPLPERVKLLMGELLFFKDGQPVSARDALRRR
jgi:hypothetical protein